MDLHKPIPDWYHMIVNRVTDQVIFSFPQSLVKQISFQLSIINICLRIYASLFVAWEPSTPT